MNQMYFHLLLFLLSRLLDTSAAKSDLPTVRETLVITEANFWIDCTTKRKSVLINGTLPGPLLSFQAGSRVIIKVINNMKKHNFTMHWHGLSMAASPWSDGTPNLSQWPIAPGKSFEYEYFLQDDNVGTYFAHSHVGLQLSTAFAPLIIHPRKLCPTAPTFAERILMVSDIWAATDDVLAKGLLAEPFKWTNNSKTLLLNGMANNNHASESCLTDLPVITVGYDMQYRLRWIGAGSLMYIAAGIEDHETTFLEADGTNLKPGKMVDHIEFAPGQRYSMRLQTKTREQVKADGKDGVYLINLSSRWRRPIVQQFAVLKYVDKPSTDPFPRTKFYDTAQNPRLREAMKTYVLPDESFGWLQTDLEPLVDRPIPENVKKNVIVLDMQQIRYGLGGFRWAMNKEIYDEEKGLRQEPYLVSLYKGALPMPQAHNNSLWDPTSEAFVLEPGQVVDIIFVNRPGPTSKVEVHPIHLHSRAVHVLAQGAGSPDIRKLLKTTYTKAYRRDTVNVYPGPGATITNSTATYDQAGGWVHTRYLASARDTGAWMMHCHITPHLLMGMASVFIVGPDALPPLIEGFSETGYFSYGGSPDGDDNWQPAEPSYFLKDGIIDLLTKEDQGNSYPDGCAAW